MKTSITRPTFCRIAVLALGCAFSPVVIPALQAKDMPASTADQMKLPVSTSFDKVAGGEKGPFVLTVKNDSSDKLKVHAKVLLAVAFHADNKARHVPEHTLKAGESMTIADLAAADKVVLTAKGYAPTTIEVPSQK